MNTEQWLYLSSIQNLIEYCEVKRAMDLLKDWSKEAKGKNMASAACHYLSHFAIPTLQGENRTNHLLPQWVKNRLFLIIPDEINTVSEWLSLFPGSICLTLNDRSPQGTIDIPEVTPEIIENLKLKNQGIFFTPNGCKGSRNSENIYQVNACFADFDEGSKEMQMEKIKGLPLFPSAIVESKRGYHAYWIFSVPSKNLHLWERVQIAIIKACESDKSIKDLPRMMRLPFSWHTKTEDKWQLKVIEWSGVLYTIDEVELAFPPEPESKSYTFKNSNYSRDLRLPQPMTLTPGVRHSSLINEATSAYAGLPSEKAKDAREALKIWYSRSISPPKPNWEKEVNDMCDWIETKQFGGKVS
jgi:hypothetical protein